MMTDEEYVFPGDKDAPPLDYDYNQREPEEPDWQSILEAILDPDDDIHPGQARYDDWVMGE